MSATRIVQYLLMGSLLLPIQSFGLVSSNGMGGGAWSAGPSWDSGVPVCGDSIWIRPGDIVTIAAQQDYSACGSPMVLIVDGIMNFPGNGPKLKLPTGSTIIVNIGGLISAIGGGNGNKISIGEPWVWEKSDGDVPGYACFGVCAPLPVQFLSVEATLVDNNVCVKWTTLTESNNDFFSVERSSDGVDYVEIAEVKGSGTTNSIIDYKVKDISPANGIYYYRVRQVDFDGSFAYSDIVSITIDFQKQTEVILYPNPILPSQDIQILLSDPPSDEEIYVEVRNIQGELKYIQELPAAQNGTAMFTVSTRGHLKPGLYFVSISTESGADSWKLLVK